MILIRINNNPNKYLIDPNEAIVDKKDIFIVRILRYFYIQNRLNFMAGKKKKKEPIRLNRLKMMLAYKNVSQKDLAEMIGKERNSISRICNNVTQPSLKLLYEISFVLDIDVRELLTPSQELPREELKTFFGKVKKKNE